jgi:hypothetical protein
LRRKADGRLSIQPRRGVVYRCRTTFYFATTINDKKNRGGTRQETGVSGFAKNATNYASLGGRVKTCGLQADADSPESVSGQEDGNFLGSAGIVAAHLGWGRHYFIPVGGAAIPY